MYRFFEQVIKMTGLNLATVGVAHGVYAAGERISAEAARSYTLFCKPAEIKKDAVNAFTKTISK